MSAQVYLTTAGKLPEGIKTFELTGAEAHHAAKVKRTNPGEVIEIVDGEGVRISGKVLEVSKNSLLIEVNQRVVESKPELTVTVAQGLAKGDRADLALETLTEVGVDQIYPWRADYSIAKWDDPKKGKDKWQAIVAQCAKQARRSWIPVVLELINTDQLAKLADDFDLAIVLHEGSKESISQLNLPERGKVLLIVGPEGGISPRELGLLSNFAQVSMGKSVMRTSTAGAVATGVILSKTRWVGVKSE